MSCASNDNGGMPAFQTQETPAADAAMERAAAQKTIRRNRMMNVHLKGRGCRSTQEGRHRRCLPRPVWLAIPLFYRCPTLFV
jgi:hypothetical protein